MSDFKNTVQYFYYSQMKWIIIFWLDVHGLIISIVIIITIIIIVSLLLDVTNIIKSRSNCIYVYIYIKTTKEQKETSILLFEEQKNDASIWIVIIKSIHLFQLIKYIIFLNFYIKFQEIFFY